MPGARPAEIPNRCHECEEWPARVTARAATAWAPPASRLVEALKYEGWRELIPWLGARLAREAGPRGGEVRLTWVPSPPRRVRRRGFNPAAELGRAVATACSIPCVDTLRRPLDGPRQVGLLPAARSANVRGVFLPRPGLRARVGGRPVILVDDVLTTGATAVEAAGVLLGHGAASVRILTFARAVPRRPDSWARAS